MPNLAWVIGGGLLLLILSSTGAYFAGVHAGGTTCQLKQTKKNLVAEKTVRKIDEDINHATPFTATRPVKLNWLHGIAH